jgi:hypothetical protein
MHDRAEAQPLNSSRRLTTTLRRQSARDQLGGATEHAGRPQTAGVITDAEFEAQKTKILA